MCCSPSTRKRTYGKERTLLALPYPRGFCGSSCLQKAHFHKAAHHNADCLHLQRDKPSFSMPSSTTMRVKHASIPALKLLSQFLHLLLKRQFPGFARLLRGPVMTSTQLCLQGTHLFPASRCAPEAFHASMRSATILNHWLHCGGKPRI